MCLFPSQCYDDDSYDGYVCFLVVVMMIIAMMDVLLAR